MIKMKYVFVFLIGLVLILEFCIFPPLSAQIKHGSFVYPELIENKKTDMLENIKVNENIFAGNWMREMSINMMFNSDGTGTIYNTRASMPFTYSYTDTTITITGLDFFDGDLIESKYNYELDGNILKLKDENNKEWYLIRQ